jgi:phage tail-like protein
MAGEAQNTIWPLPRFFFKVTLGDQGEILFQEVSSLDSETHVIDYRAGNSKVFPTIKMPGIAKMGNVTLKKGVFVKDNKFWTWYNSFKMNTIKRETVVISLLDEAGADTMVWTLTDAFPFKISGMDLKSDGNEVAVETIELAYETIVIKKS